MLKDAGFTEVVYEPRRWDDFTVVNFAKHWRETIGVAIARGAAAVVARPPPQEYGAGAGGEEEDGLAHDAASPEYSPDAR